VAHSYAPNNCQLEAEFSASLPSFDVPMTKSTPGKLHPLSKPLHYGDIRKADYAHS
jgi:hypothetical protein